ncbi:MAG TPA: hypothetical protein RMH85_06400 [Polyangiaceae bacterium LLY-WYZ-15_(1-7)]|nr:hypothetical protein [Sandaracinus sp.]HJL03114.1 hypothetical protein [Polyangiaceae bacterium LLY-WYZ-15_(1-7)]MBJ70206.1 hypothetical protein [Sandaracinus sp.]HJL08106.1 hypothetical protein [Polyangiaceae bacterium LLY-WYZ-15_(1-7)]HJL24026.1 hypothetical protein [Polyangiaceae bacterium LLY-WYZ-15_(1-7)]
MNRAFCAPLALVLVLAGCGGDDDGPMTEPGTDAGMPAIDDAGSMETDEDGGASAVDAAAAETLPPGAACDCDDECEGTPTHPGLCVQGICMTRASAACAEAGSTGECPSGSRCWGLDGFEGGVCWPDCDAVSCAGSCDSDGSCVPDESSTCTASCSELCGEGGDDCPPNSHPEGDGCVCDEGYVVNADRTACVLPCERDDECAGELVCGDEGTCVAPPCTPGSCDAGEVCAESGACIVDIGEAPPGTPPAACAVGSMGVPDWRCTEDCDALVAFDPRMGLGYDDYPLNGETAADQYRSWIRRDVMMLVRYAAAMTACQGGEWPFGNGGALGLGDMSEADGSIPGTREGSPGHPAGTHVDGSDMDLAYFQTGTGDNRLRSVCPHVVAGEDQYHCTGAPDRLDPWRTALFLGHLHASPDLRVIGVDGQVGPLIDSALTQLCADGWLEGGVCRGHSITWEETDMGRGWYRFHHHHFHISVR